MNANFLASGGCASIHLCNGETPLDCKAVVYGWWGNIRRFKFDAKIMEILIYYIYMSIYYL